jgi:hypothetical protein
MSVKDGGPAFPAVIPIEHSDVQGKDYANFTESGMTLRDWFAGHVLTGVFAMCAGEHSSPGMPQEVAEYAYKHADAMLAERKKGGSTT